MYFTEINHNIYIYIYIMYINYIRYINIMLVILHMNILLHTCIMDNMDNSFSAYSEKSYIYKYIYFYNFRSEMASHFHK